MGFIDRNTVDVCIVFAKVNNHPHFGWLEHAPKERASRATLVSMGILFMDLSPKARVFMKTIKSI
jgi:hypothetical protein